jgi:hypothetical protein
MNSQQPPLNWMGMLLVAALLRMGYELSRPLLAEHGDSALLLPASSGVHPPEEQWPSLQPWQRKASQKAVDNYAAIQERKWHRWNEVMFEPVVDMKKRREKMQERS